LGLPAVATGSTAFTPDDPLFAKQWYLGAIHAFDYWPDGGPELANVRVAVVDSGIDADHPEFAGRIAASQSFVGGGIADKQGHGTFVAGVIAAAVARTKGHVTCVAGVIAAAADNGEGIAGIAFPAELLVAKVVRSDGTISPEVAGRAMRWAAEQ